MKRMSSNLLYLMFVFVYIEFHIQKTRSTLVAFKSRKRQSETEIALTRSFASSRLFVVRHVEASFAAVQINHVSGFNNSLHIAKGPLTVQSSCAGLYNLVRSSEIKYGQ